MANVVLDFFRRSIGPRELNDRAKAEEAENLRARVLSPSHTSEIYDTYEYESPMSGVKRDDLMPTTDQAVKLWSRGRGYEIFDDMGRNVLAYKAAITSRVDIAMHLPITFLPGVKGDKDSEFVAEMCANAWEAIDDRHVAERAACASFERGFAGVELIWDEIQFGRARGLASIVEMIDRPNDWIGFDYNRRPHFKRAWPQNDAEEIMDTKMAFSRYGSLHTEWGRGDGQDCHPAVWGIDTLIKQNMEGAERAGWLPAVVRYNHQWKPGSPRVVTMKSEMLSKWKNVLFLPADIEDVDVKVLTESAHATAGAINAARLEQIRMWESWIWMLLTGSQFSQGNQQEGSFARDLNADNVRMYKAPTFAASREAMINRGFVRPFVRVNFAALPAEKWPRCSIDASFGEDQRLRMDLIERAVKMGVEVAAVTVCEEFKIPPATEEEIAEGKILRASSAPPADDPLAALDPVTAAARQMGEKDIIKISTAKGDAHFFSNEAIYTENRGWVRASRVMQGDRAVLRPSDIRPPTPAA